MLIIINENKVKQFNKYCRKSQNRKPADFCKKEINNYQKNENWWQNYYQSSIDNLIKNIKDHKRLKKVKKNDCHLSSILKKK